MQIRNVLVVDDDPAIVEGLVAFMEIESIAATGAYDRISAESLIADRFFPVVLADLRLRSEDEGLELLNSIRRMSPDSRIATITGHADPETEELLLNLGVHVVLRKPMPAEEVVGIVRDLLATIEQVIPETCDPTADTELLYASVSNMLHAIARRRYRLSPEDADEIVQETWCLFLQKRAMIRAPKPWLAATAANLCRRGIQDICRSRDRRGEMVLERSASPAYDATIAVRAGLEQIDGTSRRLCELIGLEEWSYAEVSDELRIPIGSVGPSFMRAKQKLRRAIGHHGLDRDGAKASRNVA
jgi:DNA-directed RNA polymerase specialized sigma24 family protein